MTFIDLVSPIINKKIGKIEERDCHDQYVGKISNFHSDQDDFLVRIPVVERPNRLNCLIMILESPHIKEFLGDVGPAKGKTGSQIRKWIGDVEDLSQFCGYGLILVNAIQYQCSLGMLPECFRDDVFRAVWSEWGENKFITRLNEYYQDGDVVVNCCTKGKDNKNELRRMVHQTIEEANLNCTLLGRTHPSSWYKESNRKFTW